jgi:hypothetical protein
MITKLIVFICFKVKPLESFMDRLVSHYLAIKDGSKIENEKQKRILAEKFALELKKISSGEMKVKTYKMR